MQEGIEFIVLNLQIQFLSSILILNKVATISERKLCPRFNKTQTKKLWVHLFSYCNARMLKALEGTHSVRQNKVNGLYFIFS